MRFCTFQQGNQTAAGLIKNDGILPLDVPDIKAVIERYSIIELQELAHQNDAHLLDPIRIHRTVSTAA